MASTRSPPPGDDGGASTSSSSTAGSSIKNKAAESSCGAFLTLIDGVLVDSTVTTEDTDALSQASALSSEAGGEDEAVELRLLADDDDAVASVDTEWKCPGVTADGKACDDPGGDPRCLHSLYGNSTSKLAPGEAKDLIGPDVDGGLVWYVRILPNDYDKDGKVRILPSRDYDAKSGAPKPRRKMPFPATAAQFFSSIVRVGKPIVEDEAEAGMDDLWDRTVRQSMMRMSVSDDSPRWVFTGVLNGWPGLTCLEVRKIETRETSFMGRRKGWSAAWSVDREGAENGKDPAYSGGGRLDVKVTLRAPKWSAHGWSKDSPGFLYWVEGGKENLPLKLTYGTDIIKHFKGNEEDDPICETVHMVSHRYATGGKAETKKDKLTYHSFALLEWEHQEYCTVVEIGYLNGLGGYRGKSNWYDDKDSQVPQLYGAFPPEMVLPWKETMSEIRCHDVPYRNLEDFKSFIQKHEGHSGRFVDPQYTFSHEVRLTYCSRRNIATYLLNYIRRDRTYSEMKRNCQTFAADLCGFLAGKKDVQPFHPVNQIQYTCQKHKFLYESSKYRTPGEKQQR